MSQREKESGIDRERADEKSFLAFPVMPSDFWKNDKIHSNNNTKILILVLVNHLLQGDQCFVYVHQRDLFKCSLTCHACA